MNSIRKKKVMILSNSGKIFAYCDAGSRRGVSIMRIKELIPINARK